MNEEVFKNVQFDESNKNKISFTLAPTDVGFANTLRRLIMTGVQMVAFRADMTETGKTTDVSIIKNTTPMTNEMLADRIGLLPIYVKNPSSWSKQKYIFKLNVTNTDSTSRDVTASDIQVFEVDVDGKEVKQIPNTEFFRPDKFTQQTALLAILKGKRVGQDPETIELTAKASIGTGREHARFIPTCQCAYKYTINQDENVQKEKFEDWVVNNKKADNKEQINGDTEESRKKRDILRREYNTLELDRCYLEKDGEPYSFDFEIESIGTYPVAKIIKAGINAGIRLCDTFSNLNLKSDGADDKMKSYREKNFPRITAASNLVPGFDFSFQQQDHTLGNLLQSYMDLYMMEKEILNTKAVLTYVGYFIPHPLRDEMVLRVGVSTLNESDAREAVSQAAQGCRELFTSWSRQWDSKFKANATNVEPYQDLDEQGDEESNENQ